MCSISGHRIATPPFGVRGSQGSMGSFDSPRPHSSPSLSVLELFSWCQKRFDIGCPLAFAVPSILSELLNFFDPHPPVWGFGRTCRGWVPGSRLTPMAYLIPTVFELFSWPPEAFSPVGPGYDDKYRCRSYRFVERQKGTVIRRNYGCILSLVSYFDAIFKVEINH